MISAADYALIKNLEITTKKLVSGPLLADSRSILKGSGFEFHQLRDYEQGDDVRFIDWKSSARTGKMLVRQYLEDRNRTVYIAIDASASTYFGTDIRKIDRMRELAAILAFVALHRKDSVGLLLFTDYNEIIIPPRASRSHVYTIINTLMNYKPQHTRTDFSAPLNYLLRLRGQKSIVCFISDFLGNIDNSLLPLVARKHDLLAFRCLDAREIDFPDVGSLYIQDSETHEKREVSGNTLRNRLELWHKQQREHFLSGKVDCLDVLSAKPFVGDLVRFLRTRVYG